MTLNQSLKTSFLLLLIGIFLASCSSYKKVIYFRDIPNSKSDSGAIYTEGVLRPKAKFHQLKIRKGDILQVSVQTKVPSGPSIGIAQSSSSQVTDLPSGSSATNALSYQVDGKGNIDIPLVGKISVVGLTIPQIKKIIRKKASAYYKDPIINVRLANFKVTVLGEVSSPGTYILTQEKSTLLDALAKAGDLTIYGKRTNVLLTREVNGKEKMVRFNMNSSNIFDSPYFYLKQGDVVYVQPSRGKAFANNQAAFRIYTLVTSTISLLIIVSNFFIKNN